MATTTKKKVKYIGTETFLNLHTGEVEEMQVTNIEERDFNFTKVWLNSLLADLEIIGNKKIRVANYIFDNLNRDNIFIGTQRSVSAATKVSYPIVSDTFQRLIAADLIRMCGNGVYMVNPDKIFKGTHPQRLSMLRRYQDVQKPTADMEITAKQKLDNVLQAIKELQQEAQRLADIITSEQKNDIGEQLTILDTDCNIGIDQAS